MFFIDNLSCSQFPWFFRHYVYRSLLYVFTLAATDKLLHQTQCNSGQCTSEYIDSKCKNVPDSARKSKRARECDNECRVCQNFHACVTPVTIAAFHLTMPFDVSALLVSAVFSAVLGVMGVLGTIFYPVNFHCQARFSYFRTTHQFCSCITVLPRIVWQTCVTVQSPVFCGWGLWKIENFNLEFNHFGFYPLNKTFCCELYIHRITQT